MNPSVQSDSVNGDKTYLHMIAGETIAMSVTLTTASDVAINLTGYTAKCEIGLPTPILLTTENGGITLVNATLGQIQLNITSAVSAAFAPGAYPFDAWIVSVSGTETAILKGLVTIESNITPVP